MIEPDLRKAIVAMHKNGMGIHEITRSLGISRNTVRTIIAEGGEVSLEPRADKITPDSVLLAAVYKQCSGWKERMWEKLQDEHGVEIGYSTLTRKIRELGLGQKPRAAHVGDEPGVEMQQDTSPYRVKIGGVTVGVIGCSLYYRYSKQRYLRFYRAFNRFRMKCFFHEALIHFRYGAPKCIIDNTNLAVHHRTGADAVMHPEMIAFAKRYGFRFVAHSLGHSDRKAGEERSFWTVETNFFPGREFSSLEDLNAQAFRWATEIQANRPRAKSNLIPAQAFEYETAFLTKVVAELPAPYAPHNRSIDQYGFVAFDSNFFWLPSGERGDVTVLEYTSEIKIYQGRRLLISYPLPPDGTRNEIFPKDRPHIPYQPRRRNERSGEEEKALRGVSTIVNAYLDFILKGTGALRHRHLRELHGLYRRLSPKLFERVIERAHRYKVDDVRALDEIARLLVRDDAEFIPDAPFDEGYEDREQYREGRVTDLPDLSGYDQLLKEDDDG
jgi:transposase